MSPTTILLALTDLGPEGSGNWRNGPAPRSGTRAPWLWSRLHGSSRKKLAGLQLNPAQDWWNELIQQFATVASQSWWWRKGFDDEWERERERELATLLLLLLMHRVVSNPGSSGCCCSSLEYRMGNEFISDDVIDEDKTRLWRTPLVGCWQGEGKLHTCCNVWCNYYFYHVLMMNVGRFTHKKYGGIIESRNCFSWCFGKKVL